VSTKCCYRVDGRVSEYKDAVTGVVTKHIHTRNCGKDISILLRVDYSGLVQYRQREGRYHDIFGFCKAHGEEMSKSPKAWGGKQPHNGDHRVRNLRGDVQSISVVVDVPDPKEMARQEDKIRRMVSVKSDIKRIMGQRNTENLSMDDWRTIFGDCIDELVVEGVMES
jgi:hypothetical protein